MECGARAVMPIAIVGMEALFPGADSLGRFRRDIVAGGGSARDRDQASPPPWLAEVARAAEVPIIPVWVAAEPWATPDPHAAHDSIVRWGYEVGAPVAAAEMAAVPQPARGGPGAPSRGTAPEPEFPQAVAAWRARTGATVPHAALWVALRGLADPSPDAIRLFEAAAADEPEPHLRSGPCTPWLEWLAKRLFGPRAHASRRNDGAWGGRWAKADA